MNLILLLMSYRPNSHTPKTENWKQMWYNTLATFYNALAILINIFNQFQLIPLKKIVVTELYPKWLYTLTYYEMHICKFKRIQYHFSKLAKTKLGPA